MNHGQPGSERAKNHHVVPRRYLERFAKDGKVRVIPFGGTPRLESVRRAGRAKNFYTFTDEHGGPSDAFEK